MNDSVRNAQTTQKYFLSSMHNQRKKTRTHTHTHKTTARDVWHAVAHMQCFSFMFVCVCVSWNKTFSAQQSSIYFGKRANNIRSNHIPCGRWCGDGVAWFDFFLQLSLSLSLAGSLKIKCALEMRTSISKNTCTCFAKIIKTFFALNFSAFSKSAQIEKNETNPPCIQQITELPNRIKVVFSRTKVKCRNAHLIVWLSTSMLGRWSNETNYIRFKWNRTVWAQ